MLPDTELKLSRIIHSSRNEVVHSIARLCKRWWCLVCMVRAPHWQLLSLAHPLIKVFKFCTVLTHSRPNSPSTLWTLPIEIEENFKSWKRLSIWLCNEGRCIYHCTFYCYSLDFKLCTMPLSLRWRWWSHMPGNVWECKQSHYNTRVHSHAGHAHTSKNKNYTFVWIHILFSFLCCRLRH